MTIWIPPEQKTVTSYMRWSTITTFIILMLVGIGYFIDEYQKAEAKKQDAKLTIAKIEEHNAKVEAQQKQVVTKEIKTKHKTVTMPDGSKLCTDPDEAAKTGCRLVTNEDIEKILNRKTVYSYIDKKKDDDAEPTGGSPPPAPVAIVTEPKPKVVTKEVVKTVTVQPEVKDTKIEIDAGLVKIAMSNEASWNAIFKMLFTLLGSFFGIKLINFGFRKLEAEPKPA